MTWVLSDAPKDLKPSEMLVALILANHASSDGGHAYPSVQTIMDETRLTRRSVQTALRSLEDRGVIEEERGATRRLPAMYCFPAFRGANSARHDESGAQAFPSGAQFTTSRGANSAPKPSEEPSENRQRPPFVPPSKKTPVDPAWQPGERLQAWCAEKRYSPTEVASEVERFKNWATAKNTLYADWDAGFRNWMTNPLRAEERSRASPSNGHKPEEQRRPQPKLVDFEALRRG